MPLELFEERGGAIHGKERAGADDKDHIALWVGVLRYAARDQIVERLVLAEDLEDGLDGGVQADGFLGLREGLRPHAFGFKRFA